MLGQGAAYTPTCTSALIHHATRAQDAEVQSYEFSGAAQRMLTLCCHGLLARRPMAMCSIVLCLLNLSCSVLQHAEHFEHENPPASVVLYCTSIPVYLNTGTHHHAFGILALLLRRRWAMTALRENARLKLERV